MLFVIEEPYSEIILLYQIKRASGIKEMTKGLRENY